MTLTWSSPRIRTSDLGGGVLLARLADNEHGIFGRDDAPEFIRLIEHADRDPAVRAVILTGSHPDRFISHADLRWLQEDGAVIPPVPVTVTGLVSRAARLLGRWPLTRGIARRTPMTGAIQLDHLHRTLLRMTTSSTIFVAALNGSALGLGAELSWACDLRLMADGEHFIGHPEVLLGFLPGAGGTQRMSRLVGAHRSALAILEGRPLPAAEALDIGAIDGIVPADELIDVAADRARNLAARTTDAIGAIKRAVHLGSAMPIEDGLQLERAEFLALLPRPAAQEIMLRYLRDTEENHELTLYQPGGYDAALDHGRATPVASEDGRHASETQKVTR
ncbi:enoyl-CoA hydratase/isomerase family protein [Streptomyces chartreusis]|uniref:enoyl-CoA hydratase/isomerase family protein n=1 Tax=Streptomyces chartreusis TaxID=1969 RepID=UPI00362AC828